MARPLADPRSVCLWTCIDPFQIWNPCRREGFNDETACIEHLKQFIYFYIIHGICIHYFPIYSMLLYNCPFCRLSYLMAVIFLSFFLIFFFFCQHSKKEKNFCFAHVLTSSRNTCTRRKKRFYSLILYLPFFFLGMYKENTNY